MLTAVHSTPTKMWVRSGRILGLIAIASLSLAGCAGLVGSNGTKTPTPTSLAITNVQASATTASGFQVGWTTNAPADSAVDYGTTASYGTTAPVNPAMVTSHQMALTGLKAGTMYHFRVRSTDASGNAVASGDMTDATTSTGDTVAPTVSITSPAASATISGTVNVTATASDNVGVASVQFKVDGANSGVAITSAPYALSLNTTTLSNGNHVLSAVATDAAGNSATSASVTVNVNNTTPDTTPPTVSISAPANGATVSGTVSVTANASDNVGVASVQFRLDGASLGSLDTASPYTASWNTTTASNGTHTLSAVAKDAAGNTTTSANVSVTVNNGPADTQAPSVPTGLTATAASSSQINLSWSASTDNVGVTGYNIYRGGTKISTSASTTFQDGGLAASTTFSYTVAAFDAAGNTSAQSTAASANTQAGSSSGIPSSLGWFQIPNTAYQNLCPSDSSIQGQTGCSAVIDAWAGGAADTTRNLLVFTGGGHHDYYGNEIYALDLNTLTIKLLDRASDASSLNTNTSTYDSMPDGTPGARHTYGGIAITPTTGELWLQDGDPPSPGSFVNSTFKVQLSCLSSSATGAACWQKPARTITGGTLNTQYGSLLNYDSTTDHLWLWQSWQSQGGQLWEMTSRAPVVWTKRADTANSGAFMDGTQSGAIDPVQHVFYAAGGGKFLKVSIAAGSNYAVSNVGGSGCSGGPIGSGYPGVDYDTISGTIVMWSGGNSAMVYNPATNSCTTQTYSGGPTTTGQNGTFGRFRFFPALGVFAVCNSLTANCYTLRLEGGSGTPPPASAPLVSAVGSSGVSSSGATVTWTTDIASTSQVDYGTSTAYGSSTTLNSSMVTSHSVAISGLVSGTTYHYRVRSKNSGGNETISGDFSFTTASAGDTTPPTVSVTAPASNSTVSGTVSVSATASDNVGVTRVQFQVDGINLGAAVTQAPYSTAWDTTGASNGTHSVTAVASDAAANTATSVAVTVSVSNGTTTPPPGGANSWQSRIAGVNTPGGSASIVSSLDFDAFPTTNKQQYFQVYSAPNINTDCSVAADGCSLRFTMQPGMFQGEPGWFNYNFNSSLNALYGQGQEFYVQYRERVSSSLLSGATFTNFEGWKLNILSEGDSPSAQAGNCSNTPTDFVLVSDGTTFPWIYENCGGTGSSLSFLNSAYAPIQLYAPNAPGGGNFLDQPATGCPHYSGRGTPNTDPSCWNFVANEWFTVQEHIKIGTYGQANSVVDVWVAHDGQPAVLITNAADIAIADQGPSVTDKFGKIVLLPYATAATWLTLSNVWYDDLIVSNRRIPDPEVGTPNAPDSLTLSGISSSSVTVNWRVNSSNNSAQDDTGFLVERCTGNAATCFIAPQSGFAQIGTTAAHAISYVDSTVTAGQTYTYRVRASNANGKSSYASAICFNGGTTCGGTAGL